MLQAPNGEPQDQFGVSVDIFGDTIVVGAFGEGSNHRGVINRVDDPTWTNPALSNNSLDDAGAAYVYVRNGEDWELQAYIKASNTDNSDEFGRSVAIHGETIVVGAWEEDSIWNGTGDEDQGNNSLFYDNGAVYVFVRQGTNWSQQAYLKASNTETFDSIGYAVSLSGNTAVVGANFESSSSIGLNTSQDDNTSPQAGAAYVFRWNGKDWAQTDYVKTSNTEPLDLFGQAVDIDGNLMVITASQEDSNSQTIDQDQDNNSANRAGAAYTYTIPFNINQGVNDSWVSDEAEKQGFFFTVYESLQLVFISWFTFDSVIPTPPDTATFGAFDQRWITAVGSFEGAVARLNVELTSGGVFNSSDPEAGQQDGYGVIFIRFVNCNEAILSYDFPSLGLNGEVIIKRVLDSNVGICEALLDP